MKKKLIVLISLLALTTTIFATEMWVKQKNGEIVKFDVDAVAEVIYVNPSQTQDSTAVDVSELPLKFNVLTSNTVEITKDFSYCDLQTTIIPEKVRIDGIVYTVTRIGSWAFAGFDDLTDITIPSSVTSIGEAAFSDCKNLNVVVDNSKDKIKIENDAFYGCKSVKYNK